MHGHAGINVRHNVLCGSKLGSFETQIGFNSVVNTATIDYIYMFRCIVQNIPSAKPPRCAAALCTYHATTCAQSTRISKFISQTQPI